MASTREVLVKTDRKDIAGVRLPGLGITDIHREVKERNELKTVLRVQPKGWRNSQAISTRANLRGGGFINTHGIG